VGVRSNARIRLEGLPKQAVDLVDDIAARLAAAAEVAYPSPPKPPPGVSRLLSYAERNLIIYYQEDYRDLDDRGEGVIVVVRAIYTGT
jgi:hypothetical protein